MATARVDRVNVSASDIGFRLAPRINAAGRLCHPGEALELMLTDRRAARARAGCTAGAAQPRASGGGGHDLAARRSPWWSVASPEWRERHAYVIASQDWHEGVIGIVASRLVERYRRPVVLIAVGDEEAKGSGRSVPGYDLHAGLTAAAAHLLRYGGHKAAAGLTMRSRRDLGLRRGAGRSRRCACSVASRDRPGAALTRCWRPRRCRWSWSTSWRALEPFGLGNPGVTLLAPAATLQRRRANGRGQAPALHRRAGRVPLPRGGVRHGRYACRAARRPGTVRRRLPAPAQRVERRGLAADGAARRRCHADGARPGTLRPAVGRRPLAWAVRG